MHVSLQIKIRRQTTTNISQLSFACKSHLEEWSKSKNVWIFNEIKYPFKLKVFQGRVLEIFYRKFIFSIVFYVNNYVQVDAESRHLYRPTINCKNKYIFSQKSITKDHYLVPLALFRGSVLKTTWFIYGSST